MLSEWILSASALTAAVLLLRLIFRRRVSQKLMYALWIPVLLRLLLPMPLFHSRYTVSGAAELFETTSAPASRVYVTPTPGPDIVLPRPTGEPTGEHSSAPPVTPTPAPASPRPASQAPAARPAAVPRPLSVWAILGRLWLAGSVAAGLWLLWVNLNFAHRLRRSRQEFRREGVPVYISPEIASPCLFGLVCPAIYLTPACAEGPEEARSQVLLHEETHHKQGDHVWGCLRCLCLAVWWWNPLVWLAALCSRRDGELCCDEKVMKLLGEEGRLSYGHTLVDLVPTKAPRPFLSAATLSGGARAMKERLDRIVKQPRLWAAAAALALALAILAAACTFGGRPEAGGNSPAAKPQPSATPAVTPTPGPEPEGAIHPALPASVQEIVLSGSGKTVHITDSGTIRELAVAAEALEFRPDPEGDMNKPGAVSLSLDFVTASGTETLTLPYWLRDGAVYSAGADSIRLFGGYLGEGGEATGPEAAPEAALLLEQINTRWIVALTYGNAPEGGLSLREEGEGFQEALDLFLSLRGTPCEVPQEILNERQFALNRLYGAWRINLAWDGKSLCALWDESWYRLENAGRADLELEALFEDYGTRNLLLVPEDHSGLIEDGSMTIALEQTVFSLETILACRDLVQEKLDRGETPREEDYAGALLRLTLQNHADEPIKPQWPELAAWRDGVWYALDYAFSRYAIGYVISPGGSLADGVALTAIAPEHLLPGLYRVCVPYQLGEEGQGRDHAAFAEFEIAEALPTPSAVPEEPASEPTPEPTPVSWKPVTREMGTDWLTLPEEARWLTAEEVADWEAWFDAHWMRRQFLCSAYEGPEDVDLKWLFYAGVDTEENAEVTGSHPVTDEDIRYTLMHLGWWETECPTDKLPRQEMDAILRRYLGLGLEETKRVGLSYYYLPETDCYYHAHGDTNFHKTPMLYGYAQGEEVCLFYEGDAFYYGDEYRDGYTAKGDIYRVQLRRDGDGTRFLSNLRVLTDGAAFSFDPPQPAPGGSANETGDYGRDVTRYTPTVWEDFENYDAAQASIDEITFQITGDDFVHPFERKLERDFPGYGTLVYGEVGTGTVHGSDNHIFFVTEEGRRYELPVPDHMMGEYELTDWEKANEGRGFYFMGGSSSLATWWMNCVYETYIGAGEIRQGGSCYWTLYLPTMEVFAWFRPEDGGSIPEPTPEPTPTPTPEPTPEPTPTPTQVPWTPVTVEQWTDWLELPEGASWLSQEELSEWKAWFDTDWMRRQFLTAQYERPEDVSLRSVFYMGVDTKEENYMAYSPPAFTPEDKGNFLRLFGEWDEGWGAVKLPRSEMEAVLQKYLGLGMNDTARRGFDWPYAPGSDAYYAINAGSNAFSLAGFLYGYAKEEELSLFYMVNFKYYDERTGQPVYPREGIFRVVLRREGESVRFLSNLRALSNGTDSAYESPELQEPYPDDLATYAGRDVTVIAPEPEVFESYEAAQAATDEIDFRMGEEINDTFHRLLEREYPGYGTLVYGELSTGTIHGSYSYLYFITEDGRRYELPTPQYGMGDMELDLTAEGWSEKANQGMNYALLDSGGDTVRWWLNCVYETNPVLGMLPKQGGNLFYTLYLPTMEVYVWFLPME